MLQCADEYAAGDSQPLMVTAAPELMRHAFPIIIWQACSHSKILFAYAIIN